MAERSRKEIPVVQTGQPYPEQAASDLPHEFQHLLDWIGSGVERMEAIQDEQTRDEVFALLEGIDVLHRQALARILELGGGDLAERASHDPVARTLLEMYDLPERDERAQVETALESVYPYFHSHGGKLEVLGVENGVVRVRLSGSCEGCPGTASTLSRVVEEALREGFAGFTELVAEEPPPKKTEQNTKQNGELVGLGRKPKRRPRWVSVGSLEDLERGEMQALRPEGTALLLVRPEDGEVYAYRNGCPPGSALTLHLGRLEGSTLICPWHGCRYDARTGKRQDEEGKLTVLPVAVHEGEIKVALGTEEVEPD
jgi:nitrite reductase/ring-hydroxylating ferredoxin subunit/Fe-S cluster biogenesis protein NfuA